MLSETEKLRRKNVVALIAKPIPAELHILESNRNEKHEINESY